MNISFYQLTLGSLEQALSKLLHKIYDLGKKVVVVAESEERVEMINASLWTLGHASFLPHGSAKDGFAEKQPIWLTSEIENPNNAQVLILTGGNFAQADSTFERVLIFFDGTAPDQIQAAREAWKAYQKKGETLVFWAQEPKGEWRQQNEF